MTKTEYWNLIEGETEEGRNKIINLFATSGTYKADISFGSFKDINSDEIIYIPEYGREYLDNGELDIDCLDIYTAQDLIDMFNGNVEGAEILFDTLEWSSPSTLFDEEYNCGEIKYCSKCDKLFYDYHNKECKICGTVYENADYDY